MTGGPCLSPLGCVSSCPEPVNTGLTAANKRTRMKQLRRLEICETLRTDGPTHDLPIEVSLKHRSGLPRAYLSSLLSVRVPRWCVERMHGSGKSGTSDTGQRHIKHTTNVLRTVGRGVKRTTIVIKTKLCRRNQTCGRLTRACDQTARQPWRRHEGDR